MLTDAQLATLRADILANTDPDVVAALEIRNDNAITAWYNGDSTFVVWRTEVPVSEYRDGLVWTEVDTVTAGSARIWEWVTGQMTLPLETGKATVRQGLADAWGSQTTTRANLIAIAKRFASHFEALYTTGTGTNASPGDLVLEGPLDVNDVSRALN